MPRSKRPQRERTHDWQRIQQYTLWPEQQLYEKIRPVVLFNESAYEKGRVLSYDAAQEWYDPPEQLAQNPKVLLAPRTINEEDLWLPDQAFGWYTNWPWSIRHDAELFAPFFKMLERQTQLPTS